MTAWSAAFEKTEQPPYLEPFFPDRCSKEGLADQLARRLRHLIETAALAEGSRLLGTRELAKHLGLSRNTVARAFDQLAAEGYLRTSIGAGTFVASDGVKPRRHIRTSRHLESERARRFDPLTSCFDAIRGQGPLRPGIPPMREFPLASWHRSARKFPGPFPEDLEYQPTGSSTESLRVAIAEHICQFRGVNAQPEQIIIVEGVQAAIHLIAHVLTRTGENVAIEDPGFPLARAVFEAHELRVCAVAVDGDGLCADELPNDVNLVYVTPANQFPLGGMLSLSRRNALLEWAGRGEARYIIEDDCNSEFTSKAAPLPPLQTLDRDERVIYIGSFSATLAPAVRLGYIVAPPHLGRAFSIARSCTSVGSTLHLQATLADFISLGSYARHIRRMNGIYETRRAIVLDALATLKSRGFAVGRSRTGLHLSLVAEETFDDVAFSTAVAGQRLIALSPLCLLRRDCSGFVLGFSGGNDETIGVAIRLVVETLLAAKLHPAVAIPERR